VRRRGSSSPSPSPSAGARASETLHLTEDERKRLVAGDLLGMLEDARGVTSPPYYGLRDYGAGGRHADDRGSVLTPAVGRA
jgi:hypothetical protein